MIGIYKITSPTGKVYIGQSWDIEKRWKHYRFKSCEHQRKLYHSLEKYGFKEHLFEVLVQFDICTQEILNESEIKYINQFKSSGIELLNIANGGNAKGKHSQETIDIIKAKRALQSPPALGKIYKTRQLKLGISFRGLNWSGRKHKQESKDLQSKSKKGHKYGNKIVVNIESGIFYDNG